MDITFENLKTELPETFLRTPIGGSPWIRLLIRGVMLTSALGLPFPGPQAQMGTNRSSRGSPLGKTPPLRLPGGGKPRRRNMAQQ